MKQLKSPKWPKEANTRWSPIVLPPWSENDYFRLCNPEACGSLKQGILHPERQYHIVDNGGSYVNGATGKSLLKLFKIVAGSLFIPHVLARITFLNRPYENSGN